MPYQYLKKARLYQLAKSLVSGDDFPKMKSMDYFFYHGSERLEGFGYKVSVLQGGRWICIEHEDEPADGTMRRTSDIYANPDQNGHYRYHSHRPAPSFSDKLASVQEGVVRSNTRRNQSEWPVPTHSYTH